MNYPTAAELADMGATLERDVVLWSSRLSKEYCNTYSAPIYTRSEKNDPPAPPVYKSRYVGVTVHRNRWIAQWGPRGAVKSRVYPFTPEGELQAAWERARALGQSEPEVRAPGQVKQVKPSPALEPRGPAKRRLGGKRVA